MNAATVLDGVLRDADLRATRQWEPFRDGVEASWVYRTGENGPASAFLRYQPGAAIPWHWHPAYEHILVLEGSQSDENGLYRAGSVLISPPGTSHTVKSDEGCIVLAFWLMPVRFDGPVVVGTGAEDA